MSFFTNKKNVIVLLCIVVISVASVIVYMFSKSEANILENGVNALLSPVQKVASACTNGVRGFFSFVTNAEEYRKENEVLQSELNQLKTEYKSLEEYQAENERLKGLLGLKEELVSYDTVGANVISKESTNWFAVFTIDKGSADGISENDVVMVTGGLVGHVEKVGINWAKVVSLIDPTSSVGGYIDRIDEVAIVEGDFTLSQEGKCKLTHLPIDSALSVGDTIKTSGLSDIYPRGLLVGKVDAIYTDAASSSKYAVITPMADFTNIKEVLVIRKGQAANP